MTTSGNLFIRRPDSRGQPREIEVYFECEWSWEPGVSGSLAISRGIYLDQVTAWYDGEIIELTKAEQERAAAAAPIMP